ncbi:MAG: hypothetical protein CUN56_01110 [Phototrophicales bacterium]|nr:MAG: hypothetical protein CUN56_01110 [Phototrophicales bacterium]
MAFNNNPDSWRYEVASSPVSMPRVEINQIMKMVYMWMTLGLLVTAAVAWYFASSDSLLELRLNPAAGIISFVVLIGLAIAMGAGLNRFSPTVVGMMFFAFSAVMGFSLSLTLFAFLSPTIVNDFGQTVENPMYDPTALYAAFGTAAALFGSMTVVGFTTKADLTKMGTYLMIGVWGLFIAIILNMFLGSGTLGLLISIGGVIIFTGLTAYDTQKIKEMSMMPELQSDGNMAMKFSIYGALTLYLDFINLFLFLLQLIAASRD